MKRHTASLKVGIFIVGLTLAAGLAWAGPQFRTPIASNCTFLNCGAEEYVGSYNQDSNSASDPFVLQVYANGGECLRLEVTKQVDDLELVVVSPSGLARKNDDCPASQSGGCLVNGVPSNRCPCVKFVADVKGWYTVQASHFNGEGSSLSDFTLKYGRYTPSTNPNCSPVTDALAGSALESAKPEAAQ